MCLTFLHSTANPGNEKNSNVIDFSVQLHIFIQIKIDQSNKQGNFSA